MPDINLHKPGYDQHGAWILGSRAPNLGPGPSLMLADTLMGDEVYNYDDDRLGHVMGIMLDVEKGRIAYAVLAVGGFLSIGEKLFAIPWSLLTLDPDRKRFILNVSQEKLKSAPGFDKTDWPSMDDLAWANRVHAHFGAESYWQ